MSESRRWPGLLPLVAGLQLTIVSSSVAQSNTPPARPVLRIAYFILFDRNPEPDRAERLDRVMTEVQRFYREGMEQSGHGRVAFELERDSAGKLRLHEVRGKEAMRAYGRDANGKVREEVKAALAREKIDIDRETVLIFQLLLAWKGAEAVEIGPYVGGGNSDWAVWLEPEVQR